MKKKVLASLLSLFVVASFAPMAMSTPTDSPTASCCTSSGGGSSMDKANNPCAYKVLTKEECERFCKAKAAAIAKDPSLAQPENKCKLCRAIIKADPSMKPICKKLRKHCREMKRHCAKSACEASTAAPQASSTPSAQ